MTSVNKYYIDDINQIIKIKREIPNYNDYPLFTLINSKIPYEDKFIKILFNDTETCKEIYSKFVLYIIEKYENSEYNNDDLKKFLVAKVSNNKCIKKENSIIFKYYIASFIKYLNREIKKGESNLSDTLNLSDTSKSLIKFSDVKKIDNTKFKQSLEYIEINSEEGETIEDLAVHKVISYYKKFIKINNITNEEESDVIIYLYNNTYFNLTKKEIKIWTTPLNQYNIIVDFDKPANWMLLKEKLLFKILDILKISKKELFDKIIKILHNIGRFHYLINNYILRCNMHRFWEFYASFDHVNYGIPKNLKYDYSEFISNNNLLDIFEVKY